MSLQRRREKLTVLFVWRIKYNRAPNVINLSFLETTTKSTERAIRYAAPAIIEDTPNNITDKIYTHTINGFSMYTKKHFCDQYNTDCTTQNCYVCNSLPNE